MVDSTLKEAKNHIASLQRDLILSQKALAAQTQRIGGVWDLLYKFCDEGKLSEEDLNKIRRRFAGLKKTVTLKKTETFHMESGKPNYQSIPKEKPTWQKQQKRTLYVGN